MLKKIVAMSLGIAQLLCVNTVFAQEAVLVEPEKIIMEKNGGIISPINRKADVDILKEEMEKVTLFSDTEYNNDINNLKYVSPVKNQGKYGLCWAFASSACMESLLMRKDNVEKVTDENLAKYDLSELHVAYATSNKYKTKNTYGFSRAFSDGGNTYLYSNYLTKDRNIENKEYNGAIVEKDFPYQTTGYSDEYVEKHMRSDEIDYIPSAFSEIDLRESFFTEEEIDARNDIIKKALIENGAVEIGIYCGESANNANQGFMNSNGDTVFYDNNVDNVSNHAVTVVGYDDNYSYTNFAGFAGYLSAEDGATLYPSAPSRNGAFIVKNSWGSSWGNNGYFYMSYDSHIDGIDLFGEPIERDSYDYLYDCTPNYYPAGTSYEMKDGSFNYAAIGANVYNAKTQGEKITRVGVDVPRSGSYLKFYVDSCITNDDSTRFDEKKEIAVKEINSDTVIKNVKGDEYMQVLKPGYYIFELETPVEITGNKFAIISGVFSDESSGLICVEQNVVVGEGEEDYLTVEKDGESYLTYDISALNSSTEEYEYDFVIKAYTIAPDIEITIDGKPQTIECNSTINAEEDIFVLNSDGSYSEFDKTTKIKEPMNFYTRDYISAPNFSITAYQTSESLMRFVAEIENEEMINENIKEINEIGIKYIDINGNESKETFEDLYKNIDNYEKNAEGNYIFKTKGTEDYEKIYEVYAYVKYTLNNDAEKVVNSLVKYYL